MTESDAVFTNWSGSVSFTPKQQVTPQSAADVAAAIRGARASGKTVRPVGSGHSSTPLVATDDMLMTLDGLTGLTSHDVSAGRARVGPGTGLSDAGRELGDAGLGLENMGDVDYQSIAGAIGTGTHGTGLAFGCLSTMLMGGELITGTGELVKFGEDAGPDHDPDLLRAVRVSLGMLGVMTSMTVRVRPAYELHRQNWVVPVDWVLANFDELIGSHRNVDFYWYPRSDLTQVRILNEPGQEGDIWPDGKVKKEGRGPSYHVIPNEQQIKYEEMEYMLPLEVGMEVFGLVRERIKQRHRSYVGWRVLVRTVAEDDALLSPFHGRRTLTIALLQNATLEYQRYFDDLEPLFLSYGGRPHWGKKHSRTAEQLQQMYPEWDLFQSIRGRLDPHGVFLNDYLRSLTNC